VGTLYLVRHGQASFGAADYDNLSELGAEQAQFLGKWFADAKIAPSRLISGGLRRHQQTSRAWAQGFTEQGGVLPEASFHGVDPRWNEYDHEDIFGKGTKAFGLEGIANKEMSKRDFQKLFEKAIARWIGGLHDAEYTEPWSAFHGRCAAALSDVKQMRGETVVVFSSGGAIGATVAHVLGLTAAHAMQFNYLIANCSVSRVIYRDDEASLASFNNFALFETNPDLLTYR
jgi:broad specificity phosphatase PhoE